MIKFIIYFVIFYLIGYYYGVFSKGPVFDNFFVMIILVFILIFLFEWIISLIKEKRKPEAFDDNNQDIETWEDMLKEIKEEIEKTWCINYKNNCIKIVNKYNQEELYINDKLVCKKKRKSWYSWMIPYQTLTGVIEENGHTLLVKAKLGGFVSLTCRLYVNKQLIFKEKIKFNLLSSEKKIK
ncbi:hypothetical protein BKP45_02930 [Anaerobacillus alkalidiazotrophicus]|uniref:Uncharacterized protein n=1 Tax=Anaerobacillus alkalidiazotrophicus TaxID=472963 RepID=A0A1S2MAT3_9BACI|nr:hypothetical protein [Anaerobacillus alkalidiazotrophicus]OIJ21690.1 hypothetical protein BKP45_02930 [Anaerobacillus alkalidiazotrophicus]